MLVSDSCASQCHADDSRSPPLFSPPTTTTSAWMPAPQATTRTRKPKWLLYEHNCLPARLHDSRTGRTEATSRGKVGQLFDCYAGAPVALCAARATICGPRAQLLSTSIAKFELICLDAHTLNTHYVRTMMMCLFVCNAKQHIVCQADQYTILWARRPPVQNICARSNKFVAPDEVSSSFNCLCVCAKVSAQV